METVLALLLLLGGLLVPQAPQVSADMHSSAQIIERNATQSPQLTKTKVINTYNHLPVQRTIDLDQPDPRSTTDMDAFHNTLSAPQKITANDLFLAFLRDLGLFFE
jgi:hypothetical protein